MRQNKQWPVTRPWWAALLAVGITCGIVLSLGYLSFYLALVSLLVFWRFRHDRRLGLLPCNGLLCINEAGGWEFISTNLHQPLVLRHVWPSFAWVTLRFSNPLDVGPKGSMLQLTIWKPSVSPEAWRQLCVHVSRLTGLPVLAATQEAQ